MPPDAAYRRRNEAAGPPGAKEIKHMRLAAYQPDIAANVGALIRLAACFDTPLEVIGPCGFPMSDKDLKRVALDYGAMADVRLAASWQVFLTDQRRRSGRLVLLTTKAEASFADCVFGPDDCLLVGRESAGAPEDVHAAADMRVRIPMAPGARSLNVAMAASVVLTEALRQSGAFSGAGALR